MEENKKVEEKMEKPRHLVIIGYIGIGLIILGVILLLSVIPAYIAFQKAKDAWLYGDGKMPSPTYMFFIMGGLFSFAFGAMAVATGYRDKILKLSMKTKKYVLQENKEDMTDVATESTDILVPSVTNLAKAVKEGVEYDEDTEKSSATDTMYCKHCGKKIPKASKFCKECGEKQ